jgi:amino-acid N-acetyltransferase
VDRPGFGKWPERIRLLDAGLEERPGIERLLSAAGLPLPQPEDPPVTFLVLVEEGEVVACAGYEQYEGAALIRSVAVAEDRRGAGLGRRLIRALVSELFGRRVPEVWLVTLDAMPFFAEFGFEATARDRVREAVQESPEFSMHCCGNGTWMRRRL